MSDPLATYSFLPWLRQGIGNHITPPVDPDEVVILRASIEIRLTVSGTKPDGSALADQNIDQKVEIYGPGDIVGIDSKAIIKTEPENWITNFEPNYLPYIDFYEEDFAWRYTPAAPNGNHLQPWLTLVVLKEDEFEDGANMKDKPLPFFKMKEGKTTADIFPKPSELWAWAHVHVNTDLSNGAAPNTANPNAVTNEISNIIQQNPDLAYSRILCPRKLEANLGYHAFLIPTFESGRLAGLGRPFPTAAPVPGDTEPPKVILSATEDAWDNDSKIEFPYYHRWYFRTGNVGDFEYLVNLLEPKLADKTVGVRDMDVLHPGSNLPKIPDLAGVLKLGGALRVPFDSLNEEDQLEVEKFDEWDENPYPHAFTKAMAQRINLADDYTKGVKTIKQSNKDAHITIEEDEGDPDPVITSPLYGRWHALQQRLLKDKSGDDLLHNKNWVHELNLDPRFRVAAGLGTKVIQKCQEEYMQAAWEQVGKIVEANHKIRLAQMAKEVSSRFYQLHLTPLLTDKAFLFTAPVHKRVIYQNLTVHKQVKESVVPPAITSGTFRSVLRPRGATMKKLAFDEKIRANNLIERLNQGKLVIAPPRTDPSGAINLSDLKRAVKPKAKALSQSSQTPEAVDRYPTSPDFKITSPGSDFTPSRGSADSEEAIRFKEALRDAFTLVDTKFPEPERKKLDLGAMTKQVVKSIDPAFTIPKRTFDTIKLPPHIRDNMVETFAPVMVYPEIDVPMYKPLADISSELFLPNLNKIEQNSITILENNQKFIEAYMVGINHEMSRELLWREYPTDQRGTYFRQFWDVNSFLPPQPAPADIKEKLRDIPPIHKWSKTNISKITPADPDSQIKNELGTHNQRAETSGETQIVLVIRGELLKKYPTAVVCAQKADWGTRGKNGPKDVNQERVLMDLTTEAGNPPRSKLKTPLFEAKIEPDIYFFGFDLDDQEARGTLNPTSTSDDPGWFFVLKERPGEPRFGLDIDKAKTEEDGLERILNWNHLSWKDLETADGSCIELNKDITFSSFSGITDQTNEDDIQAKWSRSPHTTDAAQLAYILCQVPVMVAVHASRMLPKPKV